MAPGRFMLRSGLLSHNLGGAELAPTYKDTAWRGRPDGVGPKKPLFGEQEIVRLTTWPDFFLARNLVCGVCGHPIRFDKISFISAY